MFDESGELAAIHVSLTDVLAFINQAFPELEASVHFEDYDDYGCNHYIEIKGECANIVLKKVYGGMFCPSDYLRCFVDTRALRDASSRITHEFFIKEGKEIKEVDIGSDYANNIKEFINRAKCYLAGTSALFFRVDKHFYADGRGVHKFAHCGTSYDEIFVADEDFYTETELRLDIKSCKEDIDPFFEAERLRERYIFDTPKGVILVESPLPEEFCFDAGFDDEYISPWIATHVINDDRPTTAKGSSLHEAYEKLLNILP